jgi:hypothetical protein
MSKMDDMGRKLDELERDLNAVAAGQKPPASSPTRSTSSSAVEI